jgi:hypothetical protein
VSESEAEMKGCGLWEQQHKKKDNERAKSGQQNDNDSIEPGLTYILRATPARC